MLYYTYIYIYIYTHTYICILVLVVSAGGGAFRKQAVGEARQERNKQGLSQKKSPWRGFSTIFTGFFLVLFIGLGSFSPVFADSSFCTQSCCPHLLDSCNLACIMCWTTRLSRCIKHMYGKMYGIYAPGVWLVWSRAPPLRTHKVEKKHMRICVYIYIYIYIEREIYTYIHTCIHTHMCVDIYIYIYIYTHTHR